MPEVSREQLTAMLDKVPEAEHEAFLTHLKGNGYTLAGAGSSPAVPPPSSGPLVTPPSEGHPILEAAKGASGSPVPGLEQVGNFIANTAPGAIAEGAGNVGAMIGGLPGKMVAGGGLAVGTALGTAGEMIPRTVGDVAAQMVAGPAAKGVGMAAKAIGKAVKPATALAGKIGTALLARDIGVAEPFIENVRANPAVLKDLSNDMTVVMDHAKSLGDIMKRGVDRLGAVIGDLEEKFIGQKLADPKALKTVKLDDLVGKLKEIKFRGGIDEEGKAYHVLNAYGEPMKAPSLKLSPIDAVTGKDAELIRTFANEVDKIKDKANVVDLLRLKRRLGDEIAWTAEDATAKKIGSQANGILKGLYKDVQAKVEGLSPELKAASSHYAGARKQYDILQRKVFGGSPEEAYNRVKLRIQRGVAPQALIERAAQINAGAEKAMRALIDQVSAQQFAPYVRRGLGGIGGPANMGAIAGATWALGGHGLTALMADLFATAVSSPRFASFGIRGASAAEGAASGLLAQAVASGKANPMLLRAIAQGTYNTAQGKK